MFKKLLVAATLVVGLVALPAYAAAPVVPHHHHHHHHWKKKVK